MGKQTSSGSTTQRQSRTPNRNQIPLFDLTNRALLGQLAEPPETPISVPLQQAVSNAQGGLPYMRSQLGLGGGLINQLTGHGVGGGSQLPPDLQAQTFGGSPSQYLQSGLQSREALGLPSRKSQVDAAGFIPSAEDLQALGAVGPVRPSASGAREQRQKQHLEKRSARLTKRVERRQNKGKQTGKAERRLDRVNARLGALG